MPNEPELVIRWQNVPDSQAPRVPEEWSIETDFFTSTDGFSISFYDPDHNRLQGLELEPVELLLGSAQQLLGRVDVTVNHGDGVLDIQGRDYIADMVECNVDPTFAINKDEELSSAITGAAKTVGIKAVMSDSDAPVRNVRTGVAVGSPASKTFKTLRLSDYKPKPGQGIYDFLNKICSAHGCTMQPATTRNAVMLTAPHYDQKPAYTIRRSKSQSAGNIVQRATATRGYGSFPTFTLFVGKGVVDGGSTGDIRTAVPIADYIKGRAEIQAIVNERAVAGRILPKDGRNADGQLYRLLYCKDEGAKNQEQIDRRAYRAIGERMKDSLVYDVTVNGHTDPVTGAIWAVDTICQVEDERTGVSEPLWIKKRVLSQSSKQGGGRTTMLQMIRPYSILLEVA